MVQYYQYLHIENYKIIPHYLEGNLHRLNRIKVYQYSISFINQNQSLHNSTIDDILSHLITVCLLSISCYEEICSKNINHNHHK